MKPTTARRLRWVLGIALALVLVAGAATFWVLSLPQFGGHLDGERLARARANPHFHDGRFVNPLPPAGYTLTDVWNLLVGQFGDEVRSPPGPISVLAVDPAALKTVPPTPGLQAFWIGHAGVYAAIDGVRLLIIRCSPTTPRRSRWDRGAFIRRRCGSTTCRRSTPC